MNRFFTTTLLLLFVISAAFGNGLPNTLVVKLLSGETAGYLLADKPKLTFEGTRLVIKSDSYEAAYELSQLESYYFRNTETDGIDVSDISWKGPEVDGDRLSFSGLEAGTAVRVYSMAGVAVASTKVGKDGCAVVLLSDIPKGVYVVKYGNVSTKIQKR